MEDLSSIILGFDGRQIVTIWESIQASLPPVEHLEVKRLLGCDAIERNQALAEEARVLVALLAEEEGALQGAQGDPKAAFERSALQSQIAFFIGSIAAAAGGGSSEGAGGGRARTAAGGRRGGSSSSSSSSSSSGSSGGGATKLGGTRELVQGVLHPARNASRENELPSAAAGGGGGGGAGASAGSSWTAVAQARVPLTAALAAEEEALAADIEYLQGRVMEAASEARQGSQDTGALRARKAELQRRWLEVEASAAAAAAAAAAAPPSAAAPTSAAPKRLAAAPAAAAAAAAGPGALAAGAASSSRLHRALRAPSGRMGVSEEGAGGRAEVASAPAPAAAAAAGGSSLGSRAGRGGAALSRGASAALAARPSAPSPSRAAETEVDDNYFLS